MRLDSSIIDKISPSGSLVDDIKKYQQEYKARANKNTVMHQKNQKVVNKGRGKLYSHEIEKQRKLKVKRNEKFERMADHLADRIADKLAFKVQD